MLMWLMLSFSLLNSLDSTNCFFFSPAAGYVYVSSCD